MHLINTVMRIYIIVLIHEISTSRIAIVKTSVLDITLLTTQHLGIKRLKSMFACKYGGWPNRDVGVFLRMVLNKIEIITRNFKLT